MKRSDPVGLLVQYQVYSVTGRPITRTTARLDDGEPGITVTFKVQPGSDGRYLSALGFRPTRNGDWTLILEAEDDLGCSSVLRANGTVKVMQ